jgi:hypothetical protein
MTHPQTADYALGADPDWDSPLTFQLTPELLAHAVMHTASAVHTGWESCVDEEAILSQIVALGDHGEASVRLLEQELVDEDDANESWHDWTLEVRVGRLITVGHWQIRSKSAPLDWEWSATAAERAFELACVLLGKRVRRGLLVEEPMPRELPPHSSRH